MVRHPLLRGAPVAALLALSAGCQHASGSAAPRPDPGSEEVRVAYGTQTRRETTASIASQTQEQMYSSQSRVEEMMIGRFPGLDVIRNGTTYTFRIRGSRSLTGSNDPLVVVDGVPLTDGTRSLSTLNPGDVARIDVLKDAASTSAYGSRGANGVILITMRRM